MKPAARQGGTGGGSPAPAKKPTAAARTLPLPFKPQCRAPGCTRTRDPVYPLCMPCWQSVPDALRSKVWEHYAGPGKPLSTAWEAAAKAAIDFAAKPKAPPPKPVTPRVPLSNSPAPIQQPQKPKIVLPSRRDPAPAPSPAKALAPTPQPKKIVLPPKKRLPTYDPRAHGARCDECPARGRQVVPPTPANNVGPPQAAIVGEVPGWAEQREGKMFQGMIGRKLDKQFAKHSLKRESFHLTTAALCYPEKVDDFPKLFACCAPRLKNEIESLPAVTPVITFGAAAFRSGLGRKVAITKARGFIWTDKTGRTFLPTIDPKSVLKDAVQSPLWNLDWDRIARCLHNGGKITPLTPPSYDVPRSAAELLKSLAKFKRDEWVSLDVETTKKSATTCELLCVGISNARDTIVLPWYPWAAAILHRFFQTRTAVGHNIYAFDSIVLRRYGIELPEIEDTLIAHHAYASHFRQGMDHVASVYLDVVPWKLLYGLSSGDEKGQAKGNLSEDDLHHYNAHDAYFQAWLWIKMRKDVTANLALYDHDRENADIAREMTETGVLVDEKRRKEIADALLAKIDRLYEVMKNLVGRNFGPTKTVDIRSILFEQFHAPVIEFTEKTGVPSTGKRTLQALAVKYETAYGKFANALVMWRMCRKVLATHIERQSETRKKGLLIEADGRVRPRWKSFGTPTGRFSVSSPNVNNQKRADNRFEGEPEYRVREIYIPQKRYRFVAFDFRQIEPHLSAYLSGDKAFISAIQTGDIHTAIARILFGEDEPRLKDSKTAKTAGKHLRQVGKSCGLAISYLSGDETVYNTIVADGLPVTFSRVVAMLDNLRRRFRRYFEFVDENTVKCRKTGFVIAGFKSGRKRWLGHAPEPQKIGNTPCQGGAADVMNYTLAELRRVYRRKYKKDAVRIVMQTYDSVVTECRVELVDKIKQDIVNVCGRPFDVGGHKIVFPIDLTDGDRLSDL